MLEFIIVGIRRSYKDNSKGQGGSTEVRGYGEEQSGFDLRSEGAMTRNLLDDNFDRDFYLQGSNITNDGLASIS